MLPADGAKGFDFPIGNDFEGAADIGDKGLPGKNGRLAFTGGDGERRQHLVERELGGVEIAQQRIHSAGTISALLVHRTGRPPAA